jgi:PAS domain S-box-containing protein
MRASEAAQVRLRVDGAVLSINAFPWPGGLGLLVRAAGGEEQRDHVIAEAGAIHRLLTLDRHLGTVKLSARGTISDPDPGFCAMIGIPAGRLLGARFIDLVSRTGRAGLSGIIEQAFTGSDEGQCEAVLIDNDGLEVPVSLTIAAIRGEHGMNGAMVMVRDRRGGAHGQAGVQ